MDQVTEFCRKCGASALLILDRNYVCTQAPNVTGISHLIARRKLEYLVKPILGTSAV